MYFKDFKGDFKRNFKGFGGYSIGPGKRVKWLPKNWGLDLGNLLFNILTLCTMNMCSMQNIAELTNP